MGSFIAGFVAVMKAIPAAERLFNSIHLAYTMSKISGVDSDYSDYVSKRRALSNAIENANSREDRKSLSIVLHSLNNPELRNDKSE